jgi:hypothetical protein
MAKQQCYTPAVKQWQYAVQQPQQMTQPSGTLHPGKHHSHHTCHIVVVHGRIPIYQTAYMVVLYLCRACLIPVIIGSAHVYVYVYAVYNTPNHQTT